MPGKNQPLPNAEPWDYQDALQFDRSYRTNIGALKNQIELKRVSEAFARNMDRAAFAVELSPTIVASVFADQRLWAETWVVIKP